MSQGAPSYILDASIATKWYLDDEQYATNADQILQAFRDGHLNLYAPDHIRYEVGNALRNAVRRGRISEEHGRRSLATFLDWRIPTVSEDALIQGAYEFALAYQCALYDGLYLALAEESGFPLLHADLRLHNTLAGRFTGEFWIEDYQ